jgi:NAD(P)H-hydrate epimerase
MTLTRTNIRFTASGMEVPAVTAEQMREVDRVMMENAGRNLAALSMELLGNGWQQASYLVLAGSGGNGGGGICAARHLANHGCRVSLSLADPEHLGEVPAFQYKVFQSASGKEIRIADFDRLYLSALDHDIGASQNRPTARHDWRPVSC